ncbi:PhoH family protein [candidate division KSB1 bacterium]|nr:PhoH family protein [candidate division KSB1 bacterium]RQW08796.1 MAG: PhoH family protein [candidate division KSB1 bacterium]
MVEKRIVIKGIDPLAFYGTQDANIRFLTSFLDAKVVARGGEVLLRGSEEQVARAERVVNELIYMINKKGGLDQDDIETVVRLSDWQSESLEAPAPDSAIYFTKRGVIKPKTEGQETYWASAQKNDILFVIGPAGTGKTFLAVAIALAQLRDKDVDRIILCRPAVEAGESLGFLPGDLQEKVDPYLRPLYDALFDMVPSEKLKKQFQGRIIEVVPLAYMRGRTLNNCFVILDEAQNATSAQMKMFLTRLGPNSKAIVTGDVTQIDLPHNTVSGLVEIQGILKGIDGIDFVYLTDRDVVRHRLVRQIIKAYESFNGAENLSS